MILKQRTIKILGLFAGLLLLAGFAWTPSRNWIINNGGRWHPLMLHFPIGLLVIAYAMELLHRFAGQQQFAAAIPFVLKWGAVSAFIAASSGWLLHIGASYDHDLLAWHQWTGVATAALAILAWYFQYKQKSNFYFISFSATVLLLLVAGHFGGSLTHGEDFLTENLYNTSAPGASQRPTVGYGETEIWEDVLVPIFEAKCWSCHNLNKRKGDLVMIDSAYLMKGGESGKVLLAGNAGESELYRVLQEPLESDRHMPPSGKVQLSAEEVELIEWWINTGAPFRGKIAEQPLTEKLEEYLNEQFSPPHPVDLLGIPMASSNKMEQLKEQGFRITLLDPAKPWLLVNLSDRKNLSKAELKKLKAIAPQIGALDLGNTPVADDWLASLRSFKQLRTLKLDQTQITGKSLSSLQKLPFLEVLNLYGTAIQDDDLPSLADWPSLKKVFLWNTEVSENGVTTLSQTRSDLVIDFGKQSQNFSSEPLMMPHLKETKLFFSDSIALQLTCKYPGVTIRYTLDGSEPDEQSLLFQQDSMLAGSVLLKARAFKAGWTPSKTFSHQFVKVGAKAERIKQMVARNATYPGKNKEVLIDFEIGSDDYTEGAWVGFQGDDYLGVIDLGSQQLIQGISVHAMEAVRSWIFYPAKIELWGGTSANQLYPLGNIKLEESIEDSRTKTRLFNLESKPAKVRFLKVKINNFGKLPEWHEGVGNPAWLFLSEIVVF